MLQQLLLAFLTSVVTALAAATIVFGKKVVTVVNANNIATKYLLKDRITQICSHWLRVGYIPPNEAECLQDLKEQYKSFGGNSYVDGLVARTLSLPMEKGE